MQPRGKAGSPHRSDGRLAPSSAEVVDAVLARLRTARPELETWTEQLRAWLAADLLQPLVRLLNGTHKVRTIKSELLHVLGHSSPYTRPLYAETRMQWQYAASYQQPPTCVTAQFFVQAEPVCGGCVCSTPGLADCSCMAGR